MDNVNNRTSYIIKNLAAGKTRDQLAEEFNHKDFRSLDMHMRRNGYCWDSQTQNYMRKNSLVANTPYRQEHIMNGKVGRIIELFAEGNDTKTVAEHLSFPSHRALGDYMLRKGYEWDPKTKNYFPKTGVLHEAEAEIHTDLAFSVTQIPRYLIGGIDKNKNLTMSHLLDQLLIDYARENNIRQKEIVQVALIEFFQKYGYAHEVKALLGS